MNPFYRQTLVEQTLIAGRFDVVEVKLAEYVDAKVHADHDRARLVHYDIRIYNGWAECEVTTENPNLFFLIKQKTQNNQFNSSDLSLK